MATPVLPENHPKAPQQNQVAQPAYATDPFQSALVQEGTGPAHLQSGVGFGIKQKKAYESDPFDTRINRPKYYGDEETILEDFGTEEHYRQRDERDSFGEPAPDLDAPSDQPRLDEFKETGEITAENIPDIYSLTAEELPEYGIDINAPNLGAAPEGITSGWNDADGDGYDDDGHAMGSHGPVNVPTAQGEQSIDAVFAGLDGEPIPEEQQSLWDQALAFGQKGLDYAEDYAQPKQQLTSWGDVMTTSPGGAVSAALPGPIGAIAGIGGAISKANLENIHSEHGTFDVDSDSDFGVIPNGTISSVNTPLAISPGFVGGTEVVSGNTDLAIRQNPSLDANGDGVLHANELRDAIAADQQVKREQARQAELDRIAEQDRALAEAARRAEEEAAAKRAAELEAAQRRAEEAARREAEKRAEKERADREAKAQEDARRAEAQRRANESGREQTYGGGSAVTDSHGRAVRDSSGGVVTDRHYTVQPQRDSGGGGGGGGGDSCFAKDTMFLMTNGELKAIQDIKVGDHMAEGGRVYGILQGDGSHEDWYIYGASYVTGSHFVYEDKWVPVAKSEGAELVWGGFDTWYCVLNENHRMMAEDYMLFTDFDAVDSVNDELEEKLNVEQT